MPVTSKSSVFRQEAQWKILIQVKFFLRPRLSACISQQDFRPTAKNGHNNDDGTEAHNEGSSARFPLRKCPEIVGEPVPIEPTTANQKRRITSFGFGICWDDALQPRKCLHPK